MAHEDEVVAALARDRGRALVGYAYLLTGSLRDAEDLVQDALVKTVLHARVGIDPETAEGYVRRAVLTTFIDGHRRLRRWQGLVPRLGHESTLPLPDTADQVTVQVDVRAALATLPRRERDTPLETGQYELYAAAFLTPRDYQVSPGERVAATGEAVVVYADPVTLVAP